MVEAMGVSLKTEQRRSHSAVSSFRSWVRRAEGYRGTRNPKLCMEVPVKPRRPPSLPLVCNVFPDHSSFSVLREAPMAFTRYHFKKLKCYLIFFLLQSSQDLLRRDGKILDPHANGIVDRIGNRGSRGIERPFTRLFRSKRSLRVTADHMMDDDFRRLVGRRCPVAQKGWIQGLPTLEVQVFREGIAHAHDNTPFHLAFHRHGVERLPAIMACRHFEDMDFSSSQIHFHLCHI